MKRYLWPVLKVGVPLAIIVWLVCSIPPQDLANLWARPKHWGLLAAAFAVYLTAVSTTFVRWYFLVRALGIPFHLRDAFRLGFLGYLFGFVSVGSVGGDLLKALFIAREQPGRRAEAAATVVVDRVIGLFALLLVTTAAIWLSQLAEPPPVLLAIFRLTYVATALIGASLLVMCFPGFTTGSFAEFLIGLPSVGPIFARLIEAVRMYRGRPKAMLSLLLLSMGVHVLFSIAIFLCAAAMFSQPPALTEHLIIVPLCMVAGSLPFTPAGLGTFDGAMDVLYTHVPAGGPGDVVGIVVALVYRVLTIIVAGMGAAYYWSSRQEVQALMAAAERELPAVEQQRDVHSPDMTRAALSGREG